MGLQKLKRKVDLNYRHGYTHKSCEDCNHFVAADKCADGELWEAPRCREIGVQRGRGFRINPNSICDLHDNSRALERIKRGWR